MRILSSLLNLHSNCIKDKGILSVIQEGQHRVESTALIHQRLYTHDDFTIVDMGEYIKHIASNLQDSFSSKNLNLQIKHHVKVSHLDVDSAIPLGLIINKLITNATKYSFEGRSEGSILAKLWIDESEKLCLIVKDDGIGLLVEKSSVATSFGTNLIKILNKK